MKTTRNKVWKKVLIAVLLLLLISVSAVGIWFFVTYYSVGLDENTIVAPARNLVITDDSDNEVPINSALNKYAAFDDINPNIIQAFVATEDKRFFEHSGVDVKRLFGAMAHNIKAGYWKEGGSTITQQLIKNTQLSAEKSLTRKVKEIRLATQIEEKYTKEQILEMYLNAIYFGNGIYGIDEVCKQYFAKKPSEITVPEAAVLAGVVKNPRKNSLLNSIENANARKNLILRLMFEQKMIEETEYDEYIGMTVTPTLSDETYRPYSAYVDAVLNEASEILGITEKELIENKYRIVTYLDSAAQEKIYQAYRSGEVTPTNKNGVAPAYATIAMNNLNSGVSAYVSDLKQSVFDFRRQPGSAIKPFLAYLPALEKFSYCPITPVEDAPITRGNYSPKNYHEIYLGKIPLRQAVASSSNTVAVGLASEVGLSDAKELSARAGITFHKNDTSLPIVLGGMTEGVTLTELASAYATIANLGVYTKGAFVKAIFDERGNTLYQRKTERKIAFSSESAALMTDMLEYTVQHGTAKKLAKSGFPIAAKTGTVGRDDEGNNDAWCAAYTTDCTVVSWYGNLSLSTNDAMSDNITGGSYPSIIAAEAITQLQHGKRPKNFEIPYTVVEAEIDKKIYDESGEYYLVPEVFPDDFKLKSLFRATDAPEVFSPNSVVPEPEDFDIYIYNCPLIMFNAIETLKYRIYRQQNAGEVLLEEIDGRSGAVEIMDFGVESGSFLTYRINVENQVGIKENFYKSILF